MFTLKEILYNCIFKITLKRLGRDYDELALLDERGVAAFFLTANHTMVGVHDLSFGKFGCLTKATNTQNGNTNYKVTYPHETALLHENKVPCTQSFSFITGMCSFFWLQKYRSEP